MLIAFLLLIGAIIAGTLIAQSMNDRYWTRHGYRGPIRGTAGLDIEFLESPGLFLPFKWRLVRASVVLAGFVVVAATDFYCCFAIVESISH